MIIYLYVKTHNVTGFKYLGKTVNKDPHKYPGSGLLWTRHLNKHGHDYSTEIIKECSSKEEVKMFGLHYSELWNVVESNKWANMRPESGNGGAQAWTEASRQKVSDTNRGKKHTDEAKRNHSAAQQKQAPHLSKKQKEYLAIPENYEKRCKQLASNWDAPGYRETLSRIMSNLKWYNDGIRNYRKPSVPVGMLPGRLQSPESIAKESKTREANGTMHNNPGLIAKRVKARRDNGSYKRSAESITKMLETRSRNKAVLQTGIGK